MTTTDGPLGHSRAAHAAHGWCSHCRDRSVAEELLAWRVRENSHTGCGEHDPDGPPEHDGNVPLVGEMRHGWCPTCQAASLAMATISAATTEGVTIIGGYAVCEGCGWSPYADTGGLP
ncbi:hypothetical protein F5972_08205 [Microbispora cellulosiformans]|uniref:Uncharacterized protein n=1 Tax=Microbispora cellulosiformans TaxID=2614688 RepID=A0A5J5K5Q3_9ACTN|nr:hypothetical protein [Microbispora cellulosiformans]KAA9379627.1 hypothetical protein F5972_08205 [Microbispora cellulosiformans]